jgi:hypothetical protein
MKTATAPMIAHIAQEVTTLADCIKITRKDGQVFAYTSYDQDIVLSEGGSPETFTTYKANGSYVPSALKSDATLSIPNQDIDAAITATDITYQELVAGKFNGAIIHRFLINWADLTMGKIILPGYKFGQLTPKDSYFTVELRGLADALRARIGEVAAPSCQVDLFSVKCGLNADTYKQSGTVLGTDGAKTMVVSGITSSIFALIEETLVVSPKSPPWNFVGGINAAFDFGESSDLDPTLCSIDLVAGQTVGVYYQTGLVKISDSERPYVDADGQDDDLTGDTTGTSGGYFPTHYAITGKTTLGKGGLIVAFVDKSTGEVIEVHADGRTGLYTVPVGATGIQLGINDDIFGDNHGTGGIDTPDNHTGFTVSIQVDRGVLDSSHADFSEFDGGGRIAFTSGDNDGYTTEIKYGITDTSTIVLYLATPLPIQVGDTFDIWPACDKQPTTCKYKYKNLIHGFRGQMRLPGIDAAKTTKLIPLAH